MKNSNNTPKHPFASLEDKALGAAFDSLYDQYSGALFKAILDKVSDQQIAEDVLQETALKVWKSMGQYDAEKGRLYTWLHRIAVNTALDSIRQKNKKKNRKNKKENEPLSIENVLVMPEIKDEMGIRKMVSSLDEKHRAPIELFYFQGYTQEAIAKKLNIPLGTIKSRLRSALKKLSKVLTR
ncbi:sigma-70 family RNA polymerase sigma factor [Chitinophaga oryzae]|uniref:Sigma-70 family RNA polymerase sigma factor n=1 Tax=Chitinophaga oryzae TaxID=2725414 RepID=A0ABX6LK37_9BACT|nr:sigma-70 family RNA polymerase sigma factor [Chitinophaga oryzae]QJB40372.1 sigma-70 family RNA polymerase sigma factor [Chitinophaga oryzae]